ncbi:multiple monosaccharide ABC transporter substrate-binding protein (plasmid) [Streptomyces sp. AHU1]|uniref:multiple monosaccharide ABC transporter substrate-binding protein n=1 Tax=Streptomyces sp. AHU1 TaxID=3377215 RepID=UPI00387844A4
MRYRRSALVGIAGAASLSLVLSGCGQSDAGGTEGSGVIGISMPTRTSERWIRDGNDVVKNLHSGGYETNLVYGDNIPSRQVSQINHLIDQGVDALVIAAIDAKSLTDVLQRASDANIPVIAYDRLILNTPNVDYYITFDNDQVGRLEARYIIDKLGLEEGKGPFNIELFAGSADDSNAKLFFNGSMDLLRPYLENKQLIVQSGQTEISQITTPRWDGANAQKRMKSLLTTAYDSKKVDAVLSPYDGISLGVLAALKEDGYGSGSKPLPIITGQDAEKPSIKSIIDGQQTETVFKDFRELARKAANMVYEMVQHRQAKINTSTDNGLKIVPTYELEPQSVDKTNYESLLIESEFYTAADLR